MRQVGRLFSLALVSSAVLAACTSQPLGPSAISSTTAVPSASASTVASTGSGVYTISSVAGGRPASPGVVYVTGQGLYYDTFVTVDPLPPRGRFQPIGDSDGDGISDTPYGPGDPGYVGGRWWMDTNGNGVQDPEDHYFLCPLLGPGRETP